MTHYAIEILYAYAQLGLAPGASREKINQALTDAGVYRFATRARTEQAWRFTEFFVARDIFGTLDDSFSEIRKAWHKKAKALHPDKNKSNKADENRLKAINASYEIVDKIHREAKEYFRKDEKTRRDIEDEARRAAEKEAQAAGRTTAAAEEALRRARDDNDAFKAAGSAATGRGYKAQSSSARDAWGNPSVKYMAASVPRYIRHARLYHLPRQAIIGSRFIQHKGSHSLVYDVIMLPEREFRRAQLNLGIEGHGSPALAMSRLTPAYIPIDARMVFVPETETDPYQFAKNYFIEKFGLLQASATG
jgi:curved DNA-binding protein CbpA